MSKLKHIIWDWNGTLVRDAITSWEQVNKILIPYNIPPITFNQFQEYYTHPISFLYKQAGLHLEEEKYEEVSQKWFELFKVAQDGVVLYEDTVKVLSYVKAISSTQSILSALLQTILSDCVSAYNLQEYFSNIFGLLHDFGGSKLSRGEELIQTLIDQSNGDFSKEECILIGDSCHDAEVAQALGIKCALVSRGLQSISKLNSTGFPVFSNFDELIEGTLK
jgi:phosphoglycolate phosphatase